jgi:hypothetical protein
MEDRRRPGGEEASVSSDLVEYLVIEVPSLAAVGEVASGLGQLVGAGTVRVLDHAVVSRDAGGAVEVHAVGPGAAPPLDELDPPPGEWLSDHDVQLAAMALPADSVGVIVVTEDRWAAPLSQAVRQAGGHIVAGDRIPPRRVRDLLAERGEEDR